MNDSSSSRIAAAFTDRYLDDLENDCVRTLEEYRGLFAGHDDVVEEVWAKLVGQAETVDDEQLGPWILLEEIARGGQARVYRARHRESGHEAAVKVIYSGLSAGDLRRFEREAAVVAKLRHPNICRVLAAGEDDGRAYFAMELVEGESLSTALAKTVAVPDTAAIAGHTERVEAIARALHAAHEEGVVHRDVKAANIVVASDGSPKLVDFGLASDEHASQAMTMTGDFFGTPDYMSPEQLTMNSIKLDRRTDVWSLGVTLYECLAGVRPFTAPTRESLYRSILGKEPADVRTFNPAISDDLAAVVATALEKDLDRRYQSALDFADDLRRTLDDEAVLARPPGALVKLTRWAVRHPAVATATSIAGISLIAGLIVSLAFYVTARDALVDRDDTLAELTTTLNRYEQMSDANVLEDLLAADDILWPRRDAAVGAMREWIDEAERLIERLALHREARDELKRKAAPFDETRDAELRLRAYPELLEVLDVKRASIARLEAIADRRDAEEIELDDLIDDIDEIEADPRLRVRLDWRFADREDEWRFTVLGRLLERSSDLEKRVTAMRERLAFAEEIRRKTVDDERAAWDACLNDIRGRPEYAGLEFEPIVGFVPLGKDADSKLWEFWHPGSGARPHWESSGGSSSGRVRIDEDSGLVMILVPGGRFWMGSSWEEGSPNFSHWVRPSWMPAHEVTLAPFLISKYELTQGQWLRIMKGENPSSYAAGDVAVEVAIGATNPVTDVSWFECVEAARRIDLQLPTEAQWEYACRAGTDTAWWTGSEERSIEGCANVSDRKLARANPEMPHETWLDDGHGVHAPVGSYRANPFGLHDTIGNVWEWCRDRYQFRAYLETVPDPGNGLRRPATEGRFRPLRGGSSKSRATSSQSALRDKLAPGVKQNNIGFRPSRDLGRR